MGSAQGILNTKGGGHGSRNACMSVFRVAFHAPAFVRNGRMRACWCGLRTEGGRKWRGGLYETRGAADTRNTHAVHETAGVKSSAAGGIGVWGSSYETEGQEVERVVVRNAGGSRRPKYARRA